MAATSRCQPSGRQLLLRLALIAAMLLAPAQIDSQDPRSSQSASGLGRGLPASFAAAQPDGTEVPSPPPPPPPRPPPAPAKPKQPPLRDSQSADSGLLTAAAPAAAPEAAEQPFALLSPPLPDASGELGPVVDVRPLPKPAVPRSPAPKAAAVPKPPLPAAGLLQPSPKLPVPEPVPAPAPAPAAQPKLVQPVPKLPLKAPAAELLPAPAPVPLPLPEPAAPLPSKPADVGTSASAPGVKSPFPVQPAVQSSIIRTAGRRFVDDNCREFLYTGWNSYNELILAGTVKTNLPPLRLAPAYLNAQDDAVTRRFQDANRVGLSVFRVFATGGEYSGYVLQPEPGQYNETVFRALDYMLAQAGNHNLKAVLSIIDNWQITDNNGAYVRWAGVRPDDFWTSPAVKQLYMDHVKTLANRRNVYTGLLYKNDPAIFSWNLYNEPRNPSTQQGPGKPGPVTEWVNEMAAFMKRVDPNHMVTVGEEGFFPAGSPYARYNPFGTPGNVSPGWSGRVGQDFVAQHASPDIDYAAIHMWPDNWNTVELRFVPMWLEGHQLATASALPGKPLVLEEFGKIASTTPDDKVIIDDQTKTRILQERDPFFRKVYQAVQASLTANRPLRGALFWEWTFPGNARGNRGVETNDSTFSLVTEHATFLAEQPREIVAGCVPRGSKAATPAAAAMPAAVPQGTSAVYFAVDPVLAD